MAEDNQIVVVDNGSGLVKAGFSGEDAPRTIFPSIVGTPKNTFLPTILRDSDQDEYIGDEAQQKRGILKISYPIERGIVKDWDHMEKIWNHTFYVELKVSPDEHPVLLTEGPCNPKVNREKMTQTMFETFNVPAMYVGIPGVLSLWSHGRITGIVCDSGEGITQIIPICDDFKVPGGIRKFPVAGCDVTQFMARLFLFERAFECFSSARKEMMRELKEKVCFIAQDYERDL